MSADRFLDAGIAGRQAVLAGTHGREVSPPESGRGPSGVFRPSAALAAALAEPAREAASSAGADHGRSGDEDRSHVTVPALAPYAESIPAEEAQRCTAALRQRLLTGAAVVEVRPLTPDDLPTISWSGSPTHLRNVAAQLERIPTGEVAYLAVLADGHPVAKGGVDFAKEPGAGTIWQVATQAELEGLGLATRLIGALEEQVKARGLTTARLAVEPDNVRALRLYEHLGYLTIGTSDASWEAERPDGSRYLYRTTLVELARTL